MEIDLMTVTENHIQLTNINEELNRLWDENQGENKIRASLFTLILYVQKTERLNFSEELIRSVVSKFPSRVVLIVSDEESKEAYLRTSVSSETVGEGDLQIFCEIIRIEVAGSLRGRVPFIIIPQILPDLPVYLLWTQDPSTENAILPHLEPYAKRIIFDPESTHDLQGYSHAVLSLLHRFHCGIGDLNWSALSGWRHLFTQVFDTFEAFVNLVQSKIIRIHYNKNSSEFQQHTEIEAAYLQAWIASRLNWKFESIEINEGNIRLSYARPTNKIVILLIPQDIPSLNPGAIVNIEVECEKNKAHYVFKRHPQTRQVFIQYSDKDRCDIPICSTLSGVSEGKEIIEEIFYPSAGPHYREMLDILTRIPWKR
ncbi:MAG: glucose-6-phosphate dehydrogenase assembly protein OpcA [Chlamydiales bacterium]|nr:glucose-6-phosphate dehydrogenase assembly protein OpcA [Chlamydiales bacterium]